MDSQNVYWTAYSGSGVFRSDLNGAGTALFQAQGNARDMMLDGADVYWVFGGGIGRKPAAGGAPETLCATCGYPGRFALDADCVYVTEYAPGGRVYRVPK